MSRLIIRMEQIKKYFLRCLLFHIYEENDMYFVMKIKKKIVNMVLVKLRCNTIMDPKNQCGDGSLPKRR